MHTYDFTATAIFFTKGFLHIGLALTQCQLLTLTPYITWAPNLIGGVFTVIPMITFPDVREACDVTAKPRLAHELIICITYNIWKKETNFKSYDYGACRVNKTIMHV